MKAKYFILIFVLATATLYIYQDKATQTKLWGMLHQLAPELNKSTLYKWQNSKGKWQVTDKPPTKGINFTIIRSQDQVNVMPSPPNSKKN